MPAAASAAFRRNGVEPPGLVKKPAAWRLPYRSGDTFLMGFPPCLGIPGEPVLRASEAHICTSGPRHSNEDRVRRHIGMQIMQCDQLQIVNIASGTPTSLYCLSHFQNANKDSATKLRMFDCIYTTATLLLHYYCYTTAYTYTTKV
jgi:hypothetical protein